MSHSFHVSSGKQSIHKKNDIQSVTNHNHRKFKNANNANLDFTKSKYNTILRGTDNIKKDLEDLYNIEFSDALQVYNSKQTRKDRKILNYFDHVSDYKQQHLAEEIIIQFGDRNDLGQLFKKKYIPSEYRQALCDAYDEYLTELEKKIPNFKIANAVIHFDETTPHAHIVGVPIKHGGVKGLKKRVSKNKVFSRESLGNLQSSLSKSMIDAMSSCLSLDVDVSKKKGRNKNFTTAELIEYNDALNNVKKDLNILYSQKISEEQQLLDMENLSINYLEEILAKKKAVNSQINNNDNGLVR